MIEPEVHKNFLSLDKIKNKNLSHYELRSRPPISYNEDNIPDDYILSAQSFVHKIPSSYQEIQYRDDRIQWEQAIKDEINSLLKKQHLVFSRKTPK